jgi:hypothetical protein
VTIWDWYKTSSRKQQQSETARRVLQEERESSPGGSLGSSDAALGSPSLGV